MWVVDKVFYVYRDKIKRFETQFDKKHTKEVKKAKKLCKGKKTKKKELKERKKVLLFICIYTSNM